MSAPEDPIMVRISDLVSKITVFQQDLGVCHRDVYARVAIEALREEIQRLARQLTQMEASKL